MLLLLAACAPDNELVKTDPPTAPVVSILPVSPGTEDDLSVSIDVPAEDPAGGEVAYTYAWTRDGTAAGDTPGVDAGDTLRGETWIVSVTAVGERQTGGTGTASVVIENTPPAPGGVTVTPNPAFTLDTLHAGATATDADGDVVAWAWAWHVDGVLTGAPAETLDGATWFDRDQEVYVVATPSDGTADGEPVASEPMTIADTPPEPPGLAFDPAAPLPGDDLQCVIATPSVDVDGDTVGYAIAWTADGVAYADAGTTTLVGDTALGADLEAGSIWTCTVTPSDGTLPGESASISVTIGERSGACPDAGGNCALRFNGADSYVTVPDDPTLDGGGRALTVEAWVWYDSVSSNCMTTVRKGTASSPTYDYWLHKSWSPGDALFWGSWTGYTSQAFSAVTAGSWYHYAGVYDPSGAEARIYINGTMLDSSTPHGTPTANDDELRIGIDWDFGCETLGVIDEVRISSVVRYTADFSPDVAFSPDGDTLALWHFDEYEGSVASDASGNGNDGTLYNTTWTTEHP